MKIYFSTLLSDKSQGEALTAQRCPNRLLSYFYLRDRSKEEFQEYVETGKVSRKKEKRKEVTTA